MLAAAIAPYSHAQAGSPTFTNVTVHDPSVVRVDASYYVFGSHLASASTPDLMHWTQISTSAADGNALVPHPQVEFQEALTWAQTTTFWAPDVIRLADGKFRFYYCACKGDSPRSALGVAVADAVTGPYKNAGILLKSGMWGQVSPDGKIYDNAIHPNTVDPSVFFDATGKLWMVYGSYSGGIFIMSLDPATGLPYDGQGYGKKLIGGNNTTIEGPYIIYSPETQYYYLFMTFGGLDAAGGYNVRYGRSRNPDGPYVDAAGNDLTNVKGAFGTLFDNASIAPYGVKLMGNWQFLHVSADAGSLSRGYVSPGGVSIYRDPVEAKYLMVFHTRFVGRGEEHEVRVHQLYLNEDGWFVAAPHRYAHETIATVDPNQVPGDYKVINHGKAISATVNTSTIVSLNSDRTITGALSGTWQTSGDHSLTLTVGSVVYRGVVAPQWDDDNQMWVTTFSAVSSDGVSLWGSHVAAAPVPAIPSIYTQPRAQSAQPSQSVTFSVGVTATPAPTYQWLKDGIAISGATWYAYTIGYATPADAGKYSVVVTNSAGSVTSSSATLTIPQPPAQVLVPTGDGATQIINLSTRGIVASGEDALIAGFVITGPSDKKLVITGWGLNLRRFGLTGEIGRPHLALTQRVNNVDVTLAENSDWQKAGAELPSLLTQNGGQQLTASTDPAHGDAALVVTVHPGAYTVVVTPDAASASTDGIGLVEIYDTDRASGSKLVNISSRGRIETGARQMIVGVSVVGSGHARLMIRGVGPTLGAFGVGRSLANPSQTMYRQDGTLTVVSANDDWWNSAQADQVKTLSPTLGAFDLGRYSADAVLLVRVDPGTYSAVISPSTDQPGIALAEIYDANDR
jgi:arabinan endo-1,5-alpha-L-arabinosidase